MTIYGPAPSAAGEGVLFHQSSSLEEAVSMVAEGWAPLAGGTDIVPRLQWELLQPVKLISLCAIPDISGIRGAGDMVRIGSTTLLNDIAESPMTPPWLRDAVEKTASRAVRNRATLGGNLMQGRRCRFYNRPAHWRKSTGRCRRMGGTDCFAGYTGTGCVAAFRSLIAAVLVAAGASVELRTHHGTETMELSSLYTRSPRMGVSPLNGLISAVSVPVQGATNLIQSAVVSRRSSLDYPEIAIAVNHRKLSETERETVIVMTAPLPRPALLTIPDPPVKPRDEAAAWIESLIPDATTGLYGYGYLRMAAQRLVFRLWDRIP